MSARGLALPPAGRLALALVALVLAAAAGCGRYGPPQRPAAVAAAEPAVSEAPTSEAGANPEIGEKKRKKR